MREVLNGMLVGLLVSGAAVGVGWLLFGRDSADAAVVAEPATVVVRVGSPGIEFSILLAALLISASIPTAEAIAKALRDTIDVAEDERP